MKYISYKQAAERLDIESVGTIRNAANRGSLTKVPTDSQEGLLIDEQVDLFKGKKQIRYTLLSDKEKDLWNQYRKAIVETQATQNSTKTEEPSILTITMVDAKATNQQIKIIQRFRPKLAFAVSMMLWVHLGKMIGTIIISTDDMNEIYHLAYPNADEESYNEYRIMCMIDKRISAFKEILKGYPQTWDKIFPKLLDYAETLDFDDILCQDQKGLQDNLNSSEKKQLTTQKV